MALHIGFAARKGGEGKTFCAANTAGELLARGYRVLVVICDQQDDMANRYLIDQPKGEKVYSKGESTSLTDVLQGHADVRDAVYRTRRYPVYRWNDDGRGVRGRVRVPGEMYQMEIMPAGKNIYNLDDVYFAAEEDGTFRPRYNLLDEVLAPVDDDYDFILFDIPPAELSISSSAYAASDYLVIPFSGVDSTDSIEMMAESIEIMNALPEIRRTIRPLLFINRYHCGTALDEMLRGVAEDAFGDYLMKQTVRASREAEYAKMNGIPLVSTHYTKIGEDVGRLVDEMLEIVSGVN